MSDPMFLSEEQAAQMLGVHRTTLRRSVDAGLLPLHPIFVTPHLRRFRRDEVESLRGAPVPGSAMPSAAKGRGRGRS
ncbi:MAG: helix-turn-helix domain-containing protein [Leucobacter sp.]|nr:helix-turn-helix domain-containing protein [Leucobacter sp.]